MMPPRWSITSAPEHWTVADVEQWFTERKYTSITGVARRGKHDWVARAWSPDNGAVVAMTFSSGMVVAPAAAAPTKKGKIVASAPAQWGAAAKPAPAPASAPAAPKSALTQSSNYAKVPVTPVAVKGNDGIGAVGAQVTPLTAVQLEAAILATFTVVPNEGRGDCAYIAVGMASASAVGGDLGAPNLKPGGAIQAQLRQWAAKEILSNPERYPVEGTH